MSLYGAEATIDLADVVAKLDAAGKTELQAWLADRSHEPEGVVTVDIDHHDVSRIVDEALGDMDLDELLGDTPPDDVAGWLSGKTVSPAAARTMDAVEAPDRLAEALYVRHGEQHRGPISCCTDECCDLYARNVR